MTFRGLQPSTISKKARIAPSATVTFDDRTKVISDRLAREQSSDGARMLAWRARGGGGLYDQRNVLGSSTGVRISVAQGEEMPAALRGFAGSMVRARADHDPAERWIEAAGASD
jgi:hypothetical protein